MLQRVEEREISQIRLRTSGDISIVARVQIRIALGDSILTSSRRPASLASSLREWAVGTLIFGF